MIRHRLAWQLILLAGLGTGCAVQQRQQTSPEELVDNPVYQDWSRFKVGSSATYQMSVHPSGKPDQKISVTQKTELIDLDARQAVVHMIGVAKLLLLPMPVLDQRETYPARISKTLRAAQTQPAGAEVAEEGTETVEAAGRNFSCTRLRVDMCKDGKKIKTRSWVCPEVPGGLVKMEMTLEDQKGTVLETRMLLTDLRMVP